ncbi:MULTISPECIES: ABC transporter permease [unclassified Bradyrhizobium]|uniref:ABC transporter permease n=1 Tax=unclassified Bradyrhizobium TaxID=2631580 RepID=UPI002916F279|nr:MULTISPECIES: ABC transporter permease [unclassified Bradyrhizobium]
MILLDDRWRLALGNSLVVGICATAISVVLGSMAAYGLTQGNFKLKRVVAVVLVSPIMVPIVVKALAMYFALTRIGLIGTHLGLIIAHALLAMPVVIVPVYATLQGFDRSLIRAAQSLGATPVSTFFRVVLPIVLPGVASGAVFAFATSFDEVVIATFVSSPQQMTLPRMLYSGLRDQLTPAVAAVAATSLLFSLGFLLSVDRLRRRAARMAAAGDESALQSRAPAC